MLELLLISVPSAAAPCATAEGVSVVVDFNELGGGLQQVCRADGGGDRASDLFPAAGFPLTYAQRQPGFVCRVSGVPESDPCVNTSPADAYWGLWWSDGDSGEWTYSSLGAASLRIPAGGSVAFAWDQSDGEVRPGASPATHEEPGPAPAPSSPTPSPSAAPSSAAPSGQPPASGAPSTPTPTVPPAPAPSTPGGASPSPTPTPSRSPRATPSERASEEAPSPSTALPTPGSDPTPDAVTAPEGTPTTTATDDGLPVWVAPAVLALLAAVAAAVLAVRRRPAGGTRP